MRSRGSLCAGKPMVLLLMSSRKSCVVERTNVGCRRFPARRPCRGEIRARFSDKSRISWECPVCRDTGTIEGWEGTRWDRRRG